VRRFEPLVGLTGGERPPYLAGPFRGPVGGRVGRGYALNKKDLKKFKTMLEDSKKQLLLSAKKTLTEESSFDTDDLPDEIDLASSEYTQSMIFRLRDREKFLLAKIDKALARIESGTFGICEKCEEEISMKRLEARPVTTLCIRCKEEQEQKEKSFG
jgi:DnaK suppressor protein